MFCDVKSYVQIDNDRSVTTVITMNHWAFLSAMTHEQVITKATVHYRMRALGIV